MKIKLNELRKIIRRCILEVNDPSQAAKRLSQLLLNALDNPSLASAPLYGFLRTIGADDRDIKRLKGAIDSRDQDGAKKIAQNISNKVLETGLSFSLAKHSGSHESGVRRKVDPSSAA